MAEAAKRKGTALLAVMNENCTSCAGSPLCEVHCPVDDCINLLYEEMPGGGLKPYRVWVDNEKCIGCQMCYSDDLTKIHEHKTTGVVYFEYGNHNPDLPEGTPAFMWHQWPDPIVTVMQYFEQGQSGLEAAVIFPEVFQTHGSAYIVPGTSP